MLKFLPEAGRFGLIDWYEDYSSDPSALWLDTV